MTSPQPPRRESRSERRWTVLELLRWTTEHFSAKGLETARLDAECLLAHVLGCDRLGLYVEFEKPVSPEERAAFRELVKRRAGDRVPVSQLLGRKEFWSLDFRVSRDVLTPRPETEVLVAQALELLSDPQGAYQILDIGTGSGAIAITLAKERPNSAVVATDSSARALQIARTNAEELHTSDAIRFCEGSLFEALEGERFDLVVSNPPYLARAERAGLAPELDHEPAEALFAGEDGLEVLRPLIGGVREFLKPEGFLLVEIAPQQSSEVSKLCVNAGLAGVRVLKDLAQRDRAVVAQFRRGPGE